VSNVPLLMSKSVGFNCEFTDGSGMFTYVRKSSKPAMEPRGTLGFTAPPVKSVLEFVFVYS